MYVQVGDISVHQLLNRRELRITFHLTKRIGTTPFHALHAEQVIVVTLQLEDSLSAATILVGIMSTRSCNVLHGIRRVLLD